ncbi:MAG: hypothetical protein KDC34_10265 [Saprospiraceae bacterium]|nr:hypothetical protein [Saprospiraceae bacterium]
MKILLISCGATRPDVRAITNMLEEIGEDLDSSLARELTEILLDGSEVEIEVSDKITSSAFRALRKHDIDYEIME